MKFHEHRSLYQFTCNEHPETKRLWTRTKWHENAISDAFARHPKDVGTTPYQLAAEHEWYAGSQPYFKVWPAIADALARIPFTAPCSALSLPCTPIAIRFADNADARRIKTILAHLVPGRPHRQLHMFAHLGTTWDCMVFSIPDDETVEGAMASASRESGLTIEANMANALRTVVGTCLLANDPSIVSPDLIEADKEKARNATPEEIERLHDRAIRRGKFGWNIGESFDAIPHYRRPHLAIRHTGKGRTVPKIVPVKGAVVHRQKMTEVPTGYILPDGTEYEPAAKE